MPDVTVSVLLETSPDVWLELDDEPNGYAVGANSFTSQQVTHRQRKAGEVPWAEGAVITSSVRELIVEPLEIYVDGAGSNYLFETRRKVVTDALEQLVFRIRRTLGDAMVEWSCVPGDYTVDTDQPLIVATQGIIKAQISHQPAVTVTQVVP